MMRAMVLCLWLSGCGDRDDSSGSGELLYYRTCGDPVCSGYSGPTEGVPLCSEVSLSEGDACADSGLRCDLEDDCNTHLLCTDSDPTQQEGGCPISRRRHKRDVHYLSEAEVQQLSQQARDMQLARWQYRWEEGDAPAHVGFIIDDVVEDAPGSPAVMADGEHVDLYGYTSLTVAALQVQHRELQALQAELVALRAEVAALREEGCSAAR